MAEVDGSTAQPTVRQALVAALLSWALLAGFFMLCVGTWDRIDWMAAGCAGLVGAGLVGVLVRHGVLRYGGRAGWIAHLLPVARQIPIDFAIVTAELARSIASGSRGRRGVFVARGNFPAGRHDTEGVAWRAFLVVAATWSPNCYVIDIDPENNRRLAHDLVPHGPSESPA